MTIGTEIAEQCIVMVPKPLDGGDGEFWWVGFEPPNIKNIGAFFDSTCPNKEVAENTVEKCRASLAEMIDKAITKLSRNIHLDKIQLSARIRNIILNCRLKTLGDLAVLSEADLRGHRNFGDRCVREVESCLAQYGLELRKDND